MKKPHKDVLKSFCNPALGKCNRPSLFFWWCPDYQGMKAVHWKPLLAESRWAKTPHEEGGPFSVLSALFSKPYLLKHIGSYTSMIGMRYKILHVWFKS